MRFHCGVLLFISFGVSCFSFTVNNRTSEVESSTDITAGMPTTTTNGTSALILTSDDFLIEGDADYEEDVDDAANDSDGNNEDVDYFDGRIVGGRAVSIRYFPHQVSLQRNKEHICGGALVAPSLVITAAHCVDTAMQPQSYTVRVGSSQHRHGGQLVGVRQIIRHQNYSTMTLDNDVAIILLATRLAFTQNVQAIRVARRNDAVPSEKRLLVSGWGLTSENADGVVPTLRYVTVRLLNKTDCMQSYEPITIITSRMFCAGSEEGGRDSCQGDSGGPLVAYENGKAKLYGVVSFGLGCAQKEFPGVYAQISTLRPWINDQIRALRAMKDFS